MFGMSDSMESQLSRMGVTRTKPTPELFNKSVSDYQAAADWVRKRLLDHGYDCAEAQLDAYSETWYFYERGNLVLALDHGLMDRILGALMWQEWQPEKD